MLCIFLPFVEWLNLNLRIGLLVYQKTGLPIVYGAAILHYCSVEPNDIWQEHSFITAD